MPGERYKHIFLSGYARTRGFTSPVRGRQDLNIPQNRDRGRHSEHLAQRLSEAWEAADARNSNAAVHSTRNGAYIEFVGEPGYDLAYQSLEDFRMGIRLRSVHHEDLEGVQRVLASVFIPNEKRSLFLRKIQAYASQDVYPGGKPRNAKLIDSISDIRYATMSSFWRPEERDQIPETSAEWIEVWLSSDENEVISRFEALCTFLAIDYAGGALKFPERSIKLICACSNDLERIIESSDDIAEFRTARRLASFYSNVEPSKQVRIAHEFSKQVSFNDSSEVAVCILDTGVNNGHVLIRPVLHDDDMYTVDATWGAADDPRNPHGTLMAGTVAYGDLLAVLSSEQPVQLNHRLESAKIIPPYPGQNERHLWGYRTLDGISRAEIQAPDRKRIHCMAISAVDSRDRGRPSSWSAALDDCAAGQGGSIRRLIVVCAGNADSGNWSAYPASNLTDEVHDPGQSWNCLTVGAYTEKTTILDPTMNGWAAVAPAEGLSPFSTTSFSWPSRKWPIKPEVVFEGGNLAREPHGLFMDNHSDLQLLSTYHDPQSRLFEPFSATSASAALASWMAAQIQIRYPDAWPETVRALMVHSAEWTDTMRAQFIPGPNPGRQEYAKLLRICGYGVPDLDRALHCASNSLTLISEVDLQPFGLNKDRRVVTRDMHLYSLPWPEEILTALGETVVQMRITLSYFVEPSPGEVGWDNRYRYASHALRFDLNGPGESEDEFIRRVNKQARDEGEHPGTEGPGNRWQLGLARNVGSIHSDIWRGKAVELAVSNKIAVYPAVGWWRERRKLGKWNNRARYSLIVSIHTPEESANIYIPVAQQVRTQVPVTIVS